MHKQMLEFLVKRLGGKISYLKNVDLSDSEAVDMVLEDIDTYASEIVSIAKELITP